MVRSFLAMTLGVAIGVCGVNEGEQQSQEKVTPIASREIEEKVDGVDSTVTAVEVSLEAGQAGVPHHHPGPVLGYVLEGQYELGIDDHPTQIIKQGETFYEPTGCLHRVSKNPAAKGKTRVLAFVIHPRDSKALLIPGKLEKATPVK
jgi:quercetin dioxygenase-like cupin family protein